MILHHLTKMAVTVTAILAVATPAAADGGDDTDRPFELGYRPTLVCVTGVQPGQGWRVGFAIRAWNAAQGYVHLSPGCQPGDGHGELQVHSITDPALPAGWATWEENTTWTPGTDGVSWFADRADVYLNTPARDAYRGRERRCLVKSMVVHEVGHALGLRHNFPDPSSAMAYGDSIARCGGTDDQDRANLAVIYALRP